MRIQARFIWGVVACCLIQGCGNDKPSSPKHTPLSITDSFSIERDHGTDRPLISIRKSALENSAFLFHVTKIPQLPLAIGSSLKSRIVFFRKRDGKLFLMESPVGHSVSAEFSSSLPLAAFPILAETPDNITFDFNHGMARVFTTGEVYGHDIFGSKYKAPFQSADIELSYLENAEIAANNTLTLRQIARTESSSFEIRYFINPYRPNPNFTSFRIQDFRGMAFLEAFPLESPDRHAIIHAAKIGNQQPFVFAISSNTPVAYREAIRAGVLYWNRVMPDLKLAVIDAPPGVTAPSAGYNVIQWVNWDQAEEAYADPQFDPRSGEVLRAQIYIPSSFVMTNRRSALRRMLRSRNPTSRSRTELSLAGLSPESHCRLSSRGLFRGSLLFLAKEQSSQGFEKALSLISMDTLAEATAHEVGHVLGLRHNLASSLASQGYRQADKKQLFMTYMQTHHLPSNLRPTGSVMDYLPFEESVFTGALIRQGVVFDYDIKAMETLYRGRKFNLGELPPFCTDGQEKTYLDCNTFDAGKSIIEEIQVEAHNKMKELPYLILGDFYDSRAPDHFHMRRPLSQMRINVEIVAQTMTDPRNQLFQRLAKGGRFLQASPRDSLTLADERTRKDQQLTYLSKEIQRLGGLESVFPRIEPTFAQDLAKAFHRLLQDPSFTRGLSLGSAQPEFTEEEKLSLRAAADQTLGLLPNVLAENDIRGFSSLPTEWKNNEMAMGPPLAQFLKARVRSYTVTRINRLLSAPLDIPMYPAKGPAVKKTVRVNLPYFFYSSRVRREASKLLAPPAGQPKGAWASRERAEIRSELLRVLNEGVQTDFNRLKIADIGIPASEERRRADIEQWVSENKDILSALKD